MRKLDHESYMRRAIDLAANVPNLPFGAVIVGASLFGAIGAFLALPVVAVIQAWVETYVTRHEVLELELRRTERVTTDELGPSVGARISRKPRKKS